MKPAMSVASLLLLLLLLVETPQGIRFEEESLAAFRKIVDKESIEGQGGAPAASAAEVICKDDEPCSGRARKLMTKAMPMPTSKSERSSEKGVAHHHSTKETDKSKRPEDYHVEPPETYPNVLDITGMDYSPAKRKPPIHN